MNKTYIKPTVITAIIKPQSLLQGLSGAGQNGLTGATKEEYTGGDVEWSRGPNLWDEDEE